jgi:hypothetical protein
LKYSKYHLKKIKCINPNLLGVCINPPLLRWGIWPCHVSKFAYFRTTCTWAKLAPFNSGGVCQNCPAKTDGALQQNVFWPLFFPQKKGSKNFSRHKPVKLRVKQIFPDKISEILIFGPISVKFRSINSIQFPLKALLKLLN